MLCKAGLHNSENGESHTALREPAAAAMVDSVVVEEGWGWIYL